MPLPSSEMPEYLLEHYVSRDDPNVAHDRGEACRDAAEELTRQGTPVYYRHSIFVPSEETCFILFEAESADAVRDVARLAALPCERVSAAFTQGATGRAPGCRAGHP
jgi:hypothetical protein